MRTACHPSAACLFLAASVLAPASGTLLHARSTPRTASARKPWSPAARPIVEHSDLPYSTEIIGGVRVQHSAPPDTSPEGTFLLLHACGHTGEDWFHLPEESRMLRAVRDRGFVAFAPNAKPKHDGCWLFTDDGPRVRDALQTFLRAKGLEQRPLYGLGVSNGGTQLAWLTAFLGMHFAGHYYCVSAGGALPGDPGTFAQVEHHPPAAFVHMLSDPYAPPRAVKAAADALRARGTQVQVFEAQPKPLATIATLAEQDVHLSRGVLKRVAEEVQAWGYAEQRHGTNFLRYGFGGQTVDRLVSDPEIGPVDALRFRALREEIRVVEGMHAPTAEHVNESLHFLLSVGGALESRRARTTRGRAT